MKTGSLLPAGWEVPQVFRDRLGDDAGRQRIMVADAHLLIILHAPPEPDVPEREGRLYWRQPDGSWLSDQDGHGRGALERHLEQFREHIDELEKREREASNPDDYFAVIQAVGPIHRSAKHLLETLQAAREAVPAARELIVLRDTAVEIDRAAELLYHEARYGLDFEVARAAQDQAKSSLDMARSSHRLNVLVALFFPIVTLCGVFGVNLQHGLETYTPPYPFALMIGGGLLFGIVLKFYITRGTRRDL